MANRRSTEIRRQQLAQLLLEVERYLAAVDVLRADGYEPSWRSS